MSHAYLIVLEWNSANRLTEIVPLPDDESVSELAPTTIFMAPFVGRSPWQIARDFVGEVLGMLTMIVAINCLRRIALAMTNPFGDE